MNAKGVKSPTLKNLNQYPYEVKNFSTATKAILKPVILVTGCGSGIGLALTELLYKEQHYRVVATARENSLAFLRQKFPESDRFWIRPLDVTNPGERTALIEEIKNWAP
jgi:NADP-dependent 3-hydroxy acid dehydrogenase YdfG